MNAADADRGPQRLETGQVIVEPGDEHVADAVEQAGDRQQHAVGRRRQLAQGEVGHREEADDDRGGTERHWTGSDAVSPRLAST